MCIMVCFGDGIVTCARDKDGTSGPKEPSENDLRKSQVTARHAKRQRTRYRYTVICARANTCVTADERDRELAWDKNG